MNFSGTILVESIRDNPDYVKCPRCLHYHTAKENFGHTEEDILLDPYLSKEKLCDRCTHIILNQHPNHPSVPFILKSLVEQRKKYSYVLPTNLNKQKFQ